MSKVSFSKKISETMDKKMHAIDSYDLKTLMEKDDDFEVAMCIAYMTLSKEKIIDKDIKNTDRLGRLTEKVDTSEIDKVFKVGFAPEMPRIMFAKENNNTWILDNIRDSIMHGVCDIDEERKCFIINNTQFDRELKAEVPFSWFISYAKNDILSKKVANYYTIRGFYYNNAKKNNTYFDTRTELINNIIYHVNISGNRFNVKRIENRVHELFDLFSKEELTGEDKVKYLSYIGNERNRYNDRYLLSFYKAREKVMDILSKEYPGLNIKIYIDDRKNRFINKEVKKLPKFFKNYDLMYEMFNEDLAPKGMTLLKYMINILENKDSFFNSDKEYLLNWKNTTLLLHQLLTGEGISRNENINYSMILHRDLSIIKTLFLNIYGLATLVINHESLYSDHFKDIHPSEFGIHAGIKKTFFEYATKRRKLLLDELDTEILVATKEGQLSNCTNEDAKKKIQTIIDTLKEKIELIEEELSILHHILGYEEIIKTEEINYTDKEHIEMAIDRFYKHFYASSDIEVKKEIRNRISKLLSDQIEIDSQYTYSFCNNMEDVLTILRNSFSHVGRVFIGKNFGTQAMITLNDYDTDGKKSGYAVCKYEDLVALLRNPYQLEEKKKNELK
jgi:hypothetical protein